ncbi:AfsR/SARP family transcriptional regulator [Actinoplanes sp. CA-131856]
MGVRFEILGPVRAYRDAAPVDLGPVKQQALLAMLLLREGRPAPLPEIVTALWSGDPPPNATEAVYRFIGNLRRALGPSLIVLTEAGYALHPDEGAVDAHAFRAAATTGDTTRALSLWQGDPLAGLTGPFFQAARTRLVEERARLPLDPTRAEPASPSPAPFHAGTEPARVDRTRVEFASPSADPARAAPAAARVDHSHDEPAPADPARAAPAAARVDHPHHEPAPVDPAHAAPAAARVDRTRVQPSPPRVERTRVESAAPRVERTRVEPGPPRADPARVEPSPVRRAGEGEDGESHYGEPVDPWDGHDLFPPDPGRII